MHPLRHPPLAELGEEAVVQGFRSGSEGAAQMRDHGRADFGGGGVLAVAGRRVGVAHQVVQGVLVGRRRRADAHDGQEEALLHPAREHVLADHVRVVGDVNAVERGVVARVIAASLVGHQAARADRGEIFQGGDVQHVRARAGARALDQRDQAAHAGHCGLRKNHRL